MFLWISIDSIIFLFVDVRDLFRKWRDENERKSDDVIQLWEAILAEKVQKLGNERHLVLEQVFIAALDCGQIEVAEDCVRTLQAEFPGSLRVQKYKAMLLEALERYDDALDVLENIIKKDETNAAPRKRKVAILKAKGRNADAIKELCDYLKKWVSFVRCYLYIFLWITSFVDLCRTRKHGMNYAICI